MKAGFLFLVSLLFCLSHLHGAAVRNPSKRNVPGFQYIVSPDSWAFEDGRLTRNELRVLLREGETRSLTDQQIQAIIDIIMSTSDSNADDVLDISELNLTNMSPNL